MEFTMQETGVPVGSYRARFIVAGPYTENADKFGHGVSLKWQIVGGEHDRCEASRICSAKLTKKTVLGKLATAIKGSEITAGERFSFDDYVGVTGSIVVEETDSGSTRVAMFIRDTLSNGQSPRTAESSVTTEQPHSEVPF